APPQTRLNAMLPAAVVALVAAFALGVSLGVGIDGPKDSDPIAGPVLLQTGSPTPARAHPIARPLPPAVESPPTDGRPAEDTIKRRVARSAPTQAPRVEPEAPATE